ncbi:MAG TPA: acyl-CoA dehydrogenase [Halieaceae bacterium]|jgi:alkylation response protein AidB-like acyl-CoA dehydrogenase|uniref:acyl-CoA dehydrogenase family protein n=1 Tax=Haliea TaxID=475794 RepID=UPI000C611BEC|nr:acyl-CoA dehydrogenase family protein [Haliea sp.]HBQ41534.1 acyl-CoA dehydrogenase [Halieaceae bacterium]MAD64808.1 acyl-CoA dehydrogenase [Haliea sp.]MAY94314.1 acyl-CoA dehydrogenase [Haliea sp.]MBP71008.1 acyl-CoA dehydrogenase [Haliea sp.]HCD54794.1 acyl-CoA dehydrogenase [Halieaceae bacterium]|tara:strand:+ start:1961 stop:3007 length:1047 start_codon:yes stop_codon:yes gene_type:complete
MDFTFSEDQLLFQDSVRGFLVNEITPERLRAGWETDTGRDPALWQQFAELGLTGITVPEEHGGLGMDAVDFVLLAQECGYVALAEPLVNHALVAVPLLQEIGGELAARWLPLAATGEARIIAAVEQNLMVEDAHVADLLLLELEGQWFALEQGQFSCERSESIDPGRRLYTVAVPAEAEPIADGDRASALRAASLNRGALGCAAQALGLAQRMIDLSVQYTAERKQFGKAIGSFQAVKHHMANVAVRLEYAKAPVHRAAYAVSEGAAGAAPAVAQAKLMACEAANLAAKNSIQVHGAMGYTWEVDLHIFMKKAWALANTWGDAGWHKQQVAAVIFADGAALGAGATFQ